MSGSLISTGMLTNEGNNILDIKDDLDHKIKNIIIHNIPLSTSKSVTALRTIGKFISPLVHSALTPTLSHIAIQLNLEASNYVYIIEYGQYYSKDTCLKNKEPRKSTNKYDYYYINVDGARLTRLTYKHFELLVDFLIFLGKGKAKDNLEEMKPEIISCMIAEEYYGDVKDKTLIQKIYNDFCRVECDIKNKITLRELCDNFKNEKWLAKKYNVATHNCQDFATEIIKILKAVRKNEVDKVRTNEKLFLPNSLIKALWHNEDLSLVNTLGRIPVFGLFYDLGYNIGGMITDKMKK